MKNIYLILLIALLSSCQKSFEDCVLENMQGANSNIAAVQIRKACIEKYGEPAYVLRQKVEEEKSYVREAAATPGLPIEENGKDYEVIGYTDMEGNPLPFDKPVKQVDSPAEQK